MKIAIVYDRFYPEVIGGAEKRNWEVARRLAQRGHDVWLISMQYWPGDMMIRRDGVNCVGVAPAIPTFKPTGRRSIIEPIYFAYHFFKFMRHHRFDIIDCGNFPYLSCFVARWFAATRRIPLVITWYEVRGLSGWWSYNGWAGILAWLFEIGVARLTRHNVAISALTVERANRIFKSLLGRMKLIACGVAASSKPLDQKRAETNRFQLLYIGRLVAHKRVDWLIETMRVLTQEFPELKLVIIGEGPLADALMQKTRDLGLHHQIQFKGFVTAHDVETEMRRSGLLVFPSQQEGFGVVIIEAMAAGLPVIAADAPLSAARTLIDSGHNGLLVHSCEDMIATIRRVLLDKALYDRLVQGGWAAASRYDWDSVIIPEIEKYYHSLIS